MLHELAGAGFTIEADDDKLVIRPASKLTDELRAALRAAKPDLLALLTMPNTAMTSTMTVVLNSAMNGRPHRLLQAEADAAHAESWDNAAIGRFVARVSLFLRRGVNATDADDLAERLHLRNMQDDDRHLCLECKHFAGRRCGNHKAANLHSPEVGRDLAAMLQRCPGFDPES